MGFDVIAGVAQLGLGLAQAANEQKAADANAAAAKIQAAAFDKQATAAQKQYQNAIKGQALLKKSAKEQLKVNNIEAAQQKIIGREDKRAQIRELRLRRAQILSASQNSGGEGGSASTGALSALGTNFGRTISLQMGETRANRAINAARQRSVNLDLKAKLLASKGEAQAAQAGVSAAKANAAVARAGVVGATVQGQNAFLNVFSQGIGSFGDIFHNKDT